MTRSVTRISVPSDGFLKVPRGNATADLRALSALTQLFNAEAFAARNPAEAKPFTGKSVEDLNTVRSLLEGAGFRPLTKRDIALSEALNAGYLLRLGLEARMFGHDPTLADDFGVDEQSTLFGGRAVLFCRGYGTERSQGILLLPKLDYLQASVVQRSAAGLAGVTLRGRAWVVGALRQLLGRPEVELGAPAINASIDALNDTAADPPASADDLRSADRKTVRQLPLGRYGAWLAASSPEQVLGPFLAGNGTRAGQGPEKVIERVSIGNVVDAGGRLPVRRRLGALFTRARLAEPTFQELVVLWRPLPTSRRRPIWERPAVPKVVYDVADHFELDRLLPPRAVSRRRAAGMESARVAPVELRVFNNVPMANFAAVLPGNKFVFRPADALRLDVISVLSLLAVLIGQRFDDTRLSVVAAVSVALWLLRTLIGYRNALIRYDLLVNRFLTSRLVARGPGALRYLQAEVAEQRAIRASVILTWLLQQAARGMRVTRPALHRDGSEMVRSLLRADPSTILDVEGALRDLTALGVICESEDGCVDVMEPSRIMPLIKERWAALLTVDTLLPVEEPPPAQPPSPPPPSSPAASPPSGGDGGDDGLDEGDDLENGRTATFGAGDVAVPARAKGRAPVLVYSHGQGAAAPGEGGWRRRSGFVRWLRNPVASIRGAPRSTSTAAASIKH